MVIFNSRLKDCLRVVALTVAFFMFSVNTSDATSRYVSKTLPDDFPTIQLAIDASKSGDTIQVRGTVADPYTEPSFAGNLSFGEKAITLKSAADDPATVILQGNNASNSTVWIKSTDVTGSTISGITIIGARGTSNGNGGAMNIQTNIRVENCIIRDSSASAGGAVHISNAAKPTFKNCRFTNNSASNGGAVYIDGEGGPFFTNCLFTNNNRASGNGDVFYLNTSAATLTNCTITGNATDDDTIYQTGSYIPLIISNCIIDAAGNTAVNSRTIILLGTQPEPYFMNSYINGSYDDPGTTIQMVYEPTRVQTSKDVFSSYPNAYVNTSTFIPGFINSSSDYHLGMTSSCIGAGGGGSGSDFEGEIRPYYLSGRSDIGADQFNFCYLVNNNIQTGTHWFNVSLASGTQQIATNQAIGFWMQTGKVRFYRIIPQVSGVMRIWSSGATVDIKGVLSEDCLGGDLLATDDNGEGGVDFHLDYVYAEQGKVYYLGVINKDDAAGTYNLYAQMETDDRGNSCNTATTTLGAFDRTYFSSGYADKTAAGAIDFSDDEDVFKIALTVPGTLMITSQDGTSLDEVDAVLKDAGCSVVAENESSASILILYNNKSGSECYLTVKKNPYNTSGSAVAYGFNVRYYPLDDRISDVNSAISPETWSDGGVATGGSLVVSSPLTGNFSVKGNGIDIGSDTFDEFYYVGKSVAGDFVLTANVAQLIQSSGVALSAEAKAGAMMRESLDKSAKCAISSITSENGSKFNYRSEYGADGTAGAGTIVSATIPEWVRIQREDNTIYSYYSNDGDAWIGYGTTDPGQAGIFTKTYDSLGQTLNNKTYAMLAVTSNDPTRDMVNIPGHNNYTYRCKIDHTSSAANMPRDLVVSMSYSEYNGMTTKYYICQKDHTAVDNFANANVNAEADNRPRLGNVKVGTKDFQCIVPHTSSEASRPRAYHYVSYTNGILGTRYYSCRINSVNQTPYNWLGTNNTTYWTVIGEAEYNAVSSSDKEAWSSSTYYGPPNATDWPTYWTVVGTAGTSDDEWAAGRQYSSAWKEYWRLDKDATSCDCGSLTAGDCLAYTTCGWIAGTKYGVSWLDYWAPTDYTATNGTFVTDWSEPTLYETGQYATGQFSNVTLDTRDIVFIGGVGTETGQITTPGDSDIFEFDIAASGTITAQTTGCSVGHEAKISIYNFLGEKILDNGDTIDGSGNYRIDEELVTATANSSDVIAIPFTVSPGKYYLRVSALNGHTTPFEYGVTMTYTAGTDDHGDYKQNATILRKWSETVATTPLLYFKKEPGTISSASDVDFFRVDLPYKGTVKVMSDWAASSGAVVTELLDSYGNVLVSREDTRAANPHFPQSRANIPSWDSALSYIVNEIVLYNSSYYRCILAASGAAQLPTNTTYWQSVSAPPVDNSGIISRTVNPGSYYVRVSGTAGLAYLLSVDFDDFGNDVADASEARDHYAYNSFGGHFETAKSSAFQWSYDPDAFKLVVTSPNSYTIYTSGGSGTYGVLKRLTSDAPPVAVEVPDDNVVYEGYNGVGQNFKKKFTLPAGTYYIITCMQDTTKVGDYTLHIDQIDDWSDTYTGTPMGNLVTDHSGVIEDPGDIDYFRFTAASTSRVRVEVSGTIDIMMKLTDATDKRLAHSSSGILEYDVTAGSTYYLSAKPQFAMNTGSYTLTYALVTPGSSDNDGTGNSKGNDYETARQLTFAGNTASYTTGGVDLEGDYDYYYFDVTGPGVVRVYTTGNTDTYGYLFLNEGGMYNLVISNDDSDYDKTDGYNFGLDYYVNSSAAQVRRFYVKVRGYAPHETGDYQLYIRFTTGTDDHGDECEAATLVRRRIPVDPNIHWESGHIRFDEGAIGITGDRDYFRIVAGPEGTNPGTVGLYTTDGATAIDSFGYLKNEMCGTLTSNDNGSGASDGENFRINYTPDCTVGVDCVPHTYYGVVKSYNDSQTGTYDLHVVANGASVAPISTTTMSMTANGTKYFGFDAPDEGSYLSASIAGVSGYVVTPLRFTLYNGKGEVISGYENISVTTPIYAQGLDRGIHYIKISNTGATTGDFTLTLNCSGTGSIGFGNGAGSFTSTDQTLVMTGDGAPGFTGTTDNGYFVFTKETEGFDFITKVTFLTSAYAGNTQAGIELRQGLANGTVPANGKCVTNLFMRNAANNAWNVNTRYRTSAGAADTPLSTSVTPYSDGPPVTYYSYYLRMHYDRQNNRFTTGHSSDGITWTNSTSLTMTFTEPMYVGFVYASGTDGTNRTVTFSNIQYTVIPFDEE